MIKNDIPERYLKNFDRSKMDDLKYLENIGKMWFEYDMPFSRQIDI